jgi:hypothetical protein
MSTTTRTEVPDQPRKPGGKTEAEKIKERQDQLLDEALMETFPASDPVSPFHIEETR